MSTYKPDVPETTAARLGAIMEVFGTAMKVVLDADPDSKVKLEELLAQWKQELEDVDWEVQLDATSLSFRIWALEELLHGKRL